MEEFHFKQVEGLSSVTVLKNIFSQKLMQYFPIGTLKYLAVVFLQHVLTEFVVALRL